MLLPDFMIISSFEIIVFMLNSIEHEIYPSHKYKNDNDCCQFNIYTIIITTSDSVNGVY